MRYIEEYIYQLGRKHKITKTKKMITSSSLKKKKFWLKGYSLTEILIVLCIIGILIYIALPNQTEIIVQTKSIEAKTMLKNLHGLEKNYFFQKGKYSTNFQDVGFIPRKTVLEDGPAVYRIEITEATVNTFKARATSLQDFDGDGQFNTWEIDQSGDLKEVIKD